MKYALITEDQIKTISAAIFYSVENPEQIDAMLEAKRILLNLKLQELKESNHETT
jgi:hypothetical protein